MYIDEHEPHRYALSIDFELEKIWFMKILPFITFVTNSVTGTGAIFPGSRAKKVSLWGKAWFLLLMQWFAEPTRRIYFR